MDERDFKAMNAEIKYEQMTSVEWLVNELDNKDWYYLPQSIRKEIVEQAKEMEKQQLYNFYVQGGVDAIFEIDRTVEDFYNKTFKNTEI